MVITHSQTFSKSHKYEMNHLPFSVSCQEHDRLVALERGHQSDLQGGNEGRNDTA